ncbi:MAG TPA: methyltransferase domain-containing protein [Candidatus Binataceae bacterium]|nr:methyltransferase domain-containing protein [Candidatus Binataceae bacterium]
MSSENNPPQKWRADRYSEHAHFVPALGQPVLELLKPLPGERILDLACGDGVLTEKIAAAGAKVVGVDAAPDMVKAAKQRGLDAHLMDGVRLSFNREFDAVFSNAALHWMKSDPDAVIVGVARALKPGGRFVAEMGGHGCIAAITVAIVAVMARYGHDIRPIIPWYFPTVDEYRGRLERGGFAVDYIELIPRPTPLPTNMAGWLDVFCASFFERLPEEQRSTARDEVIDLLRPVLCDEQGRWTGDYIRLRFAAHLPR